MLLTLACLSLTVLAAGFVGGCSTTGVKDNPKVLPKKFPGGRPGGGTTTSG
jgi:hypothetical protein